MYGLKRLSSMDREKEEVIEHLQARLRQAMQDSAVEKQAGSEAQLDEQAIMLQQAYDRIQQLEDANSELQVRASAHLHLHMSARWFHNTPYARAVSETRAAVS